MVGLLWGTACQSPPSPQQSPKSVDSKSLVVEEKQTETSPSFAVRILPIPPRAQGALTAVVERQGAEHMGEFEYYWKKNGNKVRGQGGILPRTLFTRGDVISVMAKSLKSGTEYMSPPVTVVNSPPAITSTSLLPVPIMRDEKVRVEVRATDPDGDPISYSYTWKRNGQEIPGATDVSLDISDFQIGDSFSVTVKPRDQWDEGSPVHLPPVTIMNSPPRITSRPSPLVGEGGIYQYQVTAKDPEGDPVTFSLASGPPGMAIHPTTGLLRWHVTPSEREQEFIVEIRASDPQEATSVQKFPLRVHPMTSQRER